MHPSRTREARRKYYQQPGQKEKNLLRSRRWQLKKLYGISIEAYGALLVKQDSKCAICLSPPPKEKHLAVDHCHKTGRIRGLLCTACNLAVGNMQDNPARLRAAADYLEKT